MARDPDWLERLVERCIASYGLTPPVSAPAVWPEVGGRGVLLADADSECVSNAETLRFMAPGLSPTRPRGYLVYTDAVGGYINPDTGTSRFGKLRDADVNSLEVPTSQPESAPDLPDWSWPADMRQEPELSDAREHFLGRRVLWLFTDQLGSRLVLAGGDWLHPEVYIDLYDLTVTTSDREAIDLRARDITGQEITGLEIDTGVLEVTLANGITISSSADRNYESWQLLASGQGFWVCLPGGALAAFPFRRRGARILSGV
jgi:hypothetical protein